MNLGNYALHFITVKNLKLCVNFKNVTGIFLTMDGMMPVLDKLISTKVMCQSSLCKEYDK